MVFNLPQQQLRAVSAAMARGSVGVEALDADGTTMIDRGVIEVIDNVVDQTTGTIRVKARFPNDRLQLWPGQFVNVKVFVDVLKHVVVAPTAAVQRGPNGAYVFVVNDDDTVSLTQVTVGQQDETIAVISGGVAPPARLVTTGFARLTDKAAVSVTTPEEAARPVPAAASPGRRGAREPGNRRRRDQPGEAPEASEQRPAAGQAVPAQDGRVQDGPRQDGPRRDRPRREAPRGDATAPAGGRSEPPRAEAPAQAAPQ